MHIPPSLPRLETSSPSHKSNRLASLSAALGSQARVALCLLLVWTLVCQTLVPTSWMVQGKPTLKSGQTSSSHRESAAWINQLSGSAAGSVLAAQPATPVDPPANTLTDAVISRGHPNISSGRIEGTLRLLQGESFALSGNTQILGDVLIPGTASIQLNGGAQHGGVVNDGGAVLPNSTLTLSGGIVLPGKIHIRADAPALPSDFPSSVPAATGSRTVSVNSQSDIALIGDWQTVRDLSVTKSGLTINVPPGNYGTFTVNGNSRLNFTAGSYNFANTFNLDGSASLQATGLVTINVDQNLTINSGAIFLGSYTAPGDVHLNVLGSALKVNGSSQVSGMVRAYNGTVTLNGTAQVRGQVIANTFTLNGGKVIGAVWPAHSGGQMAMFGPRRFDRTTGPPNQYLEQFALPPGVTSPFTLHIQNGEPNGSNRVSSATIKLNGTEILIQSDLNQNVASIDRIVTLNALNTLEVRLTSNPGSYLIINISGPMPVTDTTPPALSVTSPANNTTTSAAQINFSGTASDTGTGATGVAHIYVNGLEATFNQATSTWSIAGVPLELGANQVLVRAVDGAGNETTTTVNITRAAPNHAPTVDAGPDQNFALPHSATLHGTVSDDGLPAGSSLSLIWSVVSNPGSVAFTSVNSLDSTATFGAPGTYVLRLTVSDGDLSTSDDITLTVEPANQPPTVNAGANQTVALPHTATLNGTVTDDGLPAGNTLGILWSQVSGPGTTAFENSLVSETIASFSVAGTYVLRLTATDGALTASNEVTITVHRENHAPTVNAGTDQTISLPAAAQLNGSATDDGWPFGSTLNLAWTAVSGPGSVTFANSNVSVTSASFSAPGTYLLRLTAGDGELQAIDDVVITVTPPNQAPSVNAGNAQTITLPAAASLNGTISDDGLPLGSSVSASWSKMSGPGEVTFANASQASTMAQFSLSGAYVLRLTATDGALSNTADVAITVIPENHAPTVNAGADQTVTLPNIANLNGSAGDDALPAGSTLTTTWSKVSGPGTVTFGNPNVTVTTAAFSVAGTYRLRLTASDSELNSSDDLWVEVIPENHAPTVSAGTDQTITLPNTVSLSGVVNDDGLPAGSTLTVSWTKVSGPGLVSFSSPNAATTSAAFDAAGTYILRLTGTDSQLSNSDEVQVTVIPQNHAPTANAGADQSITLPAQASLNGSAGDDGLPGGSTLTTTWSKVSGPGTVTFANAHVTVTTAAFSEAGSYVLRLTASDSELTTTDEIAITVIPENHAPTANAGTDQAITLPALASLNGNTGDDGLPAGSTLTTSWSKVSGPGAVTFANANMAVTTAAFSEAGSYVLRLTASDSQLTTSDEVTITVIPENHAPTVTAGTDQTIALPNTANLNGSAGDDGLPAGSTLTTSWSKVSGPGTVTFANANVTVTTATFSESGNYVLRLTASDSQITTSDDVVVTVDPENLTPTVNAGADQTIVLPASASLTGTVTDDGWPRNSNVTISWSQVSGPGTTTFGTPSAAQTSVSFTEAGSYVLRLTASDSQLSTADDIVITVIPPNSAPTVNAGVDQTVTLPSAVNLNGSVSDDGLPTGSSLNLSWSTVSGPGEVVFSSPSTTNTSATFCASGTYVLRLTATDSQLSGSDELTVTVRKLHTQTFKSGNGEIGQLDAYNVASRDGGLTYHPAYVIETYQSWVIVPGTNFYWETIPGTKWINWQNNYWAQQPFNWFTTPTVTKYRLSFTLPADYSNPALFGRIAADERATVRLNGTQIGQFYTAHNPGGFLSTEDATLFRAGENLIEFDVEDVCCGTHGFDYRLTISATTAVPHGNQTPAVKTGPDQTISWPNAASLSGTAIDDGLPCNTPLTVLWSMVSGPGSVTFANPNARETTASFSATGSYLLRLTANDGQFTSSDDIKVVVQPPNQAPVVNVGQDQVIRHPDGVSLNGSVTDDGLPSAATLSATWSKQSGPGDVTFADSHVALTTATFTVAGVYVLRLSASDSDLSAFDELTVSVNPLTSACTNDDFIDDFDDNSLNAGKWTIGTPSSSVAVFERNQRLELVLQPNKVDYNGLHSLSTFDLSGKSLQVEVKEPTSQAGFTETYLAAALDGSNYYLMDAGAGSLALDSYTAGVRDRTVITYQPTTHRFWRLRHVSAENKVNFETSADGTIWTIRKTVPATFALNAIRIQLIAGAWGTGNGAPGKAVFDNVRLVSLYPNCLPSVTLTDPAPNATFNTPTNINLAASASDSDGTVSKVEFFSNGVKLGEDVTSPYTFVWNNVAAGNYTLSARVIDDKGATATSFPVQITVISPNQVPSANAGPDQTINTCASNLQGAATDDGLPAGSSLAISWSKVSGPGNVNFANAAILNTSATFSLAGNYVLRLTVSDSLLTTSDDVAISVSTLSNAPASYIDPTAYLSFQDSPFKNLSTSYFYNENFEDHLLNTPGVTANTGAATSIGFGPGSHDSVDADDGLIDGHSAAGDSYFSFDGNAGLKFTFNASVLGSLPTHAGLVWTDGAGTVSFEAFDRNGVSMGLRGPFNLADGVFSDTTAEDRFLGAYDPQGISSIRVLNTSGGIEIDHLQYGFGNGANAAAVVNAGADQTLILPITTATLNGTVTDDGLPGCATVTFSWSQVSGPGTVTFANPNALNTTAAFSVVGTYVLRLTAHDSALSSSDEVTIISSNAQPPVANFVVPESTGTAGAFVIASSGFTGSAFSADKLLDDSGGTYWQTQGITNQFAKMQFFDQQNVFIDRVRLQAPTFGSPTTLVKDFDVQISATTSDDASFVTVLSGTLLNNTQMQEFVLPGGPVRTRYLKLLLKTNYGNASSFQLGTFNPVAVGSADSLLSLPGQSNVAFSQSPALPLNGGVIYNASYPGGAASATNLIGYFAGGWQTNNSPGQFAIIQLAGGTSHTIEGVRLATWYDSGYGFPTGVKDFEVWVSNTTPDDISFTKVLTATAPFVPNTTDFLFPGGPVQARYVKYVPLTNGNNGTTINTQLFDVIATGTARVVGVSQQSGSYPNSASSAFDGVTTSNWIASGTVTNVWVKTALTNDATQRIYGVRIHPMSDPSFQQGPKDFDIRVSTTTTDDSAFSTVYSGTVSTANAAQEFVFSNLVDARYVQFFWKNAYHSSVLGVRELEVLAAPERGSGIISFSSGVGPVGTLLDLDPTNQPWTTPLNQNTNISIKLVLPRAELTTISHIALRPAIAFNGNYNAPKDFQFQVSTTDSADSSFTTAFAGTLVNSIQMQDFYFAPVQAKYVRLVLLKGPNDFGSYALHNFFIYSSTTIGTTTRFVDRSSDPDGQVVSWTWNFGDGTTSTLKDPAHTFAQAGDYTVSLTVTDNNGLSNSYSSVYHVVESINPELTISPMIAHEGGESVRFMDVQNLLSVPTALRTYNFGDGSPLYTQYSNSSLYTYPDNGVFHVTLKVGDSLGVNHSITRDITVLNLVPSVDIDPGKTLVWGESWTSVPRITDQSPVDRLTLQGQWTFGDGQTSQCVNCTNANATVTHAYAHPGTYEAVLTVTDKDGGVGSDSANFIINKRPTALIFQNPPAQTDGQPLVIHAQLMDTFANQPLVGKPVQFKVNGASFNAVTGANGIAQVSVPLPAGTRIDVITGSFAEDEYYLSCGGVAVPPTAGGPPPASSASHQGTNFWLMFPYAYFSSSLPVQTLYITSPVATTGTVTIPGLNFTHNFTVQANTVLTVQLPFSMVYENNTVTNKGIHVVSQLPVSVYGLDKLAFSSDAFLGLPVSALGMDYYILTYSNMGFAPSSELGVVATENSTVVTITPSVTSSGHASGVPFNVTLNQGETYLLQNLEPTALGDLSGSRVTANKPVAVFAGHEAATIPAESVCCADHLVEQLPPTLAWGKRFATIPLATRTKGDFFRFIAAEDATAIYLNGNQTALLNRGQWVERILKTPSEIIATAPIMVTQYSTSIYYDPPTTGKADPFTITIPPYSQFLNHYTITTPATGFQFNYANVVAPTASLGSITMDGTPIPAGSFAPIGVSGYSGAQVTIPVGSHNFDGPVSFGVFVYGYNQDEGYGYPGGMNMTPTVQNTNVALAPETSSNSIQTQSCVVATVTNQDQYPVGGRTINFIVTGVNPSSASATTDAAGQAQFCYTGANTGSDLVTAGVGSASGTASVQWQTNVPNQPPVVTAGADQTVTLPAPANLQGSATDDGLPTNTLNLSWSKVSGPGDVTFTTPSAAVTSSTFDAPGVYVLRLTASDSSLSTSDDVEVTVNPTPPNQPPAANAGPDQSVAVKGNLIVNPGNEEPLINGEISGWREEQGTTWTQGNSSINGLPDAHRGQNYFYVGADGAEYAELRQDVDVSAFAANIAAGTQQFEFQTYVRSASEFPYPDNPRIVVEFRNALNTAILATMEGGNGYAINNWYLTETLQAAPVGTGWIRVRLIATRSMGGLNDAYFDSVSLRAVGKAAVKLSGAVTDDGLPYGSSVSASWTAVSGPGAVTFANTNAAGSAASFTTPGTYVLRLTAGDGQANTSDDVTITVYPQNQPPVVTGNPNQTITLPATATLNGVVNDDGLPHGSSVSTRWRKDSGPGTVTFANPNAASTTASFSTQGFYVLILVADDSDYSAHGSFQVSVNPAPAPTNQPPTVSPGPNQTISLPTNTVTLNGTATDDGLPAGSTLTITWSKVSGPGAVTFGNANSAVTTAQLSAVGSYVLRLSASDGAYLVSADVGVILAPQNFAPTANAGPDQTTILSAGAQLNGSASDDGLPAGSNLTTNWTKVSGPGTVTFMNPNVTITGAQFSAIGTYVLRLTASDGAVTASDELTVIVNDNVAPPTVQITAPADDASITEPTIVTGSVSGGSWVLEYSLASDDNPNNRIWTTFGTGTGAASGTLGTLDPTMMLNGLFTIRLSATDSYGQTSRTSISVIVEGNLKVGNFTLSFTDVSIPVAGVPMEVSRTYDSRNKQVGDFGFGWTMGLRNIRVEKAGVIGLKWYETASQEVFPNYCLQAIGSHVVTVTFPEGKVFKFQPTVSPQCQRFAPVTGGTLGFAPMPGTVGKLEVVGDAAVQVEGSIPGPVNLLGFGSGVDIFNSFVFKFTSEDGTSYIIDQRSGLQSLTDPYGNTLTISPGGIVHSNGKSITFNRDSLGRIASITDPNGNSQTYTYDANGDLVAYTDAENQTSTCTYDANHRLLTIHDPRGIQPIRNDYDADGRLISHTDAFGKIITYIHDLTNRIETVTDRLGNPTVLQYDARGNVLTKTDARGGITSFTYDANDNVLAKTNALGKTTTYTYDAFGHRTSVTDPLGNVTHSTYNALGRLLTSTDAMGRVITNTYNGAGSLLTTEDALHNVTTYTYSIFDGQPRSLKDAQNNTTLYEYTNGFLTKQTDPLGHEMTFNYDANNNQVSRTVKRTNAQGQLESITTTYEYDKLNRLKKTTFPDGSFTLVEYNAGGQQSATIDQFGRRTEATFDDMGRLTRTTYPDGTHEDMTYDAEGHKLTSTDRAGRVTSFTYNAVGQLTRTTYPDGTSMQTGFDLLGRVFSTTDPRGNTTTFEYDPNCGCGNRRSKITDAMGNSTTFTYDDNGNQLSMTDALSHTTTYEYDANNRRIKTTYADGTFETAGYDVLGRAISKTDQAGKTTQFTYDAVGHLIKVKNALNQETHYTYDEAGNQISQTDALNHTTRYEYDQHGRRIKRIFPGGQTESYSYMANNRLQSKVDFNGKTSVYGYDIMGRLLTKTPDPSLNQPAVTFTYSTQGQRATMTDASGTTSYSYDNRNRLVSKQSPQGTLTYSYDAAGNLLTTRSSNANGLTVDYGYDVMNRLATVKDNSLPAGANTTSYTYDDVGNLKSYAYPNAVSSTYVYNALNRLTTVSIAAGQTNLAGYNYTLGATGNRTSVVEQDGRTVNYTYDSLYRLTSETITGVSVPAQNGSVSNTYDAVGNRLSRTSTLAAVPSTTNTFDDNDRLIGEGYDANGNTLSANGSSYAYDFENRMLSANGGTVTFVYDGDGNRVAKTVNGVTTKYLVDPNNPSGYPQVVDELTGNQVTRSYTFGHWVISQKQFINSQWLVSFYGYDGHGNVRLLTDFTGAVTDTYTYDAFGNLISRVGNTPNDHLYAGEQFDANVGFYYLRARYLNPMNGRFLSSDPAKGNNSDPRSLHKYVYAINDPVNRIDPSGLMSLGEASAVVAMVGVLGSIAAMGFITYKVLHNLPPNPFAGAPHAALIGYELQGNASYVAGKAFGPAGAVATALLSGLGGVDVLVPFASPKLWIYGYAGLGFGFEVDDVMSPGSLSLHVGLIWNVPTSGYYSGPFFCSSLATSSVNVGRFGFPLANMSVCSSRDQETNEPTGYGFQVKVLETGSNSPGVSTSYTYYSQATEVSPENAMSVAPSYQSLVDLARQLMTRPF